jgi:hypothetical protein
MRSERRNLLLLDRNGAAASGCFLDGMADWKSPGYVVIVALPERSRNTGNAIRRFSDATGEP